jgi:hypothetical protein
MAACYLKDAGDDGICLTISTNPGQPDLPVDVGLCSRSGSVIRLHQPAEQNLRVHFLLVIACAVV